MRKSETVLGLALMVSADWVLGMASTLHFEQGEVYDLIAYYLNEGNRLGISMSDWCHENYPKLYSLYLKEGAGR